MILPPEVVQDFFSRFGQLFGRGVARTLILTIAAVSTLAQFIAIGPTLAGGG